MKLDYLFKHTRNFLPVNQMLLLHTAFFLSLSNHPMLNFNNHVILSHHVAIVTRMLDTNGLFLQLASNRNLLKIIFLENSFEMKSCKVDLADVYVLFQHTSHIVELFDANVCATR